MPSAIDATKPQTGQRPALSADLRNNFAAAKSEIEALQVGFNLNQNPDVIVLTKNLDGNPLTFTSNGVSFTNVYVSSGAAIGKIQSCTGGGVTKTFTYDVNGFFESMISV